MRLPQAEVELCEQASHGSERLEHARAQAGRKGLPWGLIFMTVISHLRTHHQSGGQGSLHLEPKHTDSQMALLPVPMPLSEQ